MREVHDATRGEEDAGNEERKEENVCVYEGECNADMYTGV